MHNYLCSAPKVFFLCVGTGLPPIYSQKLRIIKKPLALSLSLSAMTLQKLNPSGVEERQRDLAVPECRWSYNANFIRVNRSPSRVAHSKLKDLDVNRENV